MKAKFLCPLVLFVGLSGAFTIGTQEAQAQPDTPPKQVAQQTHSVTAFKIEHLRVEMMLQWLQTLITPNAKQNAEVEKAGGAPYQIPGLESVAANPKENEVWATGTPESIAKLREFIGSIDQPARTVDLKVQFIEVDEADTDDFGVTGDKTPGEVILLPNSEFQDKLRTLTNSRRARTLHTAQVTTFNNSPAKVSSPANAVAPSFEWSATPTIQNDNTVTLFFSHHIGSNDPQIFLTTVANIEAGKVMVLSIKNPNDERRDMLAIVSTQIVEE